MRTALLIVGAVGLAFGAAYFGALLGGTKFAEEAEKKVKKGTSDTLDKWGVGGFARQLGVI